MTEPTTKLPTVRRLRVRVSLPRLVGALYERASPAVRTRLLQHLLDPVGPLALVAIAAGAFGRLLPPSRWNGAQVTPEDSQAFEPWQIAELVRYVEQKSPEWLLQMPQAIADPQLWLGSGLGVLLLLLLQRRQRRMRRD